jgi:hypothetical protein
MCGRQQSVQARVHISSWEGMLVCDRWVRTPATRSRRTRGARACRARSTPHNTQTLELELPDTAASLRLSSLEFSDCMSEMGALGADVTSGVQATARLVSSAEAGLRQGVAVLGTAVVPELARRETRVRGEGARMRVHD